MMEIVKSDEQLNEHFKLIVSIKGVGEQTTLFLIAYPHGFTKFKIGEGLHPIVVFPIPKHVGNKCQGKNKSK